MRPIAAAKGVLLTADATPGATGGTVHADRQRVKQVLLNLLSNAVKYNHADGAVSVATHAARDEQLAVTVTDTGRGISTSDLRRLFTPFERFGDIAEVDGIGVGLALAQQLTRAMGGEITAISKLDYGSTFTVTLPSAGGEAASLDTRTPAVVGDRHILHIEDDLANLALVEFIVAKRHTFSVVPAMSGSLGVELARQRRPALILLDVQLPDMPGEEVLRILQASPGTAQIPVVMLTAESLSAQQRDELLEAGAAACLQKPVDVPALLALLDHVPQYASTPSA
jgi:CheY-like chemotaxis protein